MRVKDGELTPKQKAFCEYYAALGNAKEAAIKAGYSPKYACENCDKLMKNPRIAVYIKSMREKGRKKRHMEIEERREALAEIARKHSNSTNPALVQSAIKAIDTLNKMDGLYIQNINANVSAGSAPILIDNISDPRLTGQMVSDDISLPALIGGGNG